MTSLLAQPPASPRRPVVIVEGNIGAGKSTLCRQLAQELNYTIFLEPTVGNPYLEKYYVSGVFGVFGVFCTRDRPRPPETARVFLPSLALAFLLALCARALPRSLLRFARLFLLLRLLLRLPPSLCGAVLAACTVGLANGVGKESGRVCRPTRRSCATRETREMQTRYYRRMLLHTTYTKDPDSKTLTQVSSTRIHPPPPPTHTQ
jgi:hypothetical protein